MSCTEYEVCPRESCVLTRQPVFPRVSRDTWVAPKDGCGVIKRVEYATARIPLIKIVYDEGTPYADLLGRPNTL